MLLSDLFLSVGAEHAHYTCEMKNTLKSVTIRLPSTVKSAIAMWSNVTGLPESDVYRAAVVHALETMTVDAMYDANKKVRNYGN